MPSRAAGGCSRRTSPKSTGKQSNADKYTSSLLEFSRLVSADRRFFNHAFVDPEIDPRVALLPEHLDRGGLAATLVAALRLAGLEADQQPLRQVESRGAGEG